MWGMKGVPKNRCDRQRPYIYIHNIYTYICVCVCLRTGDENPFAGKTMNAKGRATNVEEDENEGRRARYGIVG